MRFTHSYTAVLGELSESQSPLCKYVRRGIYTPSVYDMDKVILNNALKKIVYHYENKFQEYKSDSV